MIQKQNETGLLEPCQKVGSFPSQRKNAATVIPLYYLLKDLRK